MFTSKYERHDDNNFFGFSAAGGFGLTGMRERAAVLRGKLHIKSEPGAGTLVRIDFPCGANREV